MAMSNKKRRSGGKGFFGETRNRSIRLSENQLPKRYFGQKQAEGEHDQGLLDGRASFAHQRCALRVL